MTKDYIDDLTSLYNRKGMTELVAEFAGDCLVNVLFMDLDNFKTVNDLYGHGEGDRLLSAFAKFIGPITEDRFPIRLGGDEFVLILKGEKSRNEINGLIDNLYDRIREGRQESVGFSVISLSVGILQSVNINSDNLSEILHLSDMALYAAKDQGKSCYVYYEDIAEEIRNKEMIERKAEEAISGGIFEIKYQPIMHLQTADIVSVDTRFMWKKDDGDYWSIREYREIFEKNGYIKRFDIYMFERACEEISLIKKNIKQKISFNIMLSRLSFLSPTIGLELQNIMGKYGINFEDLELSIEERTFGIRAEEELISALKALSKLGFSISLTKFGYNFESIKYLPQMDIKTLRFDGHYIDSNYKDSKGGQILRTLIRMGKELKLHVICYGENTKEKIDFLNGSGCDSMSELCETGLIGRECLTSFLQEHLTGIDKEYVFKFKGNFVSEDGLFEGHAKGKVEFVDGICDEYGGIRFNGGDRAMNIVELPVGIMASGSYTISMWVKPDRAQGFVSVFYARYMGGFMSLMPYLSDLVTSSFRIHEDVNVDVWYDALCRSVEWGKWSYLTISYNSYNETMRYYINGRKAVTRRDVPTLLSCRDCMLGGDYFQQSFEGVLSGLTIANSSKSDDEVAQMYKEFVNRKNFYGENELFWMD